MMWEGPPRWPWWESCWLFGFSLAGPRGVSALMEGVPAPRCVGHLSGDAPPPPPTTPSCTITFHKDQEEEGWERGKVEREENSDGPKRLRGWARETERQTRGRARETEQTPKQPVSTPPRAPHLYTLTVFHSWCRPNKHEFRTKGRRKKKTSNHVID